MSFHEKNQVEQKLSFEVEQIVQPNNYKSVQPELKQVEQNEVEQLLDKKVEQKYEVEQKVVDIEAFNELVFKRAGTTEESRFYTFLDGKKIVRTKCGCNNYN